MPDLSITNIQEFSLLNQSDGSEDPIRQSIRSFWVYDGSELTYDKRNTYDDNKAYASSLNFELSKRSSGGESVKLDDDTSLKFTSPKSLIQITPRYGISMGGGRSGDSAVITPEQVFTSYIEDSIIPYLDIVTLDYKLDLDTPIEYISNVDNKSTIAGTVKFVYNYGLEIYEDRIKDISRDPELQNFYKFSPNPLMAPFSFGRKLVKGSTKKSKITKNIVSKKLSNESVSPREIQDFFMNNEGFLEALELQEKKDTFPFYNEVYFTNPADSNDKGEFRESLKESGLIMAFCDLMNREDFKLSQADESTTIIQDLPFTNSYREAVYASPQQLQFIVFPNLREDTIKFYDVPKMLQMMYQAIPKSLIAKEKEKSGPTTRLDTRTLRSKGFLADSQEAQYRLDTVSKLKSSSTAVYNYENSLDDLVARINELLANNANYRSYPEILQGTEELYQSNVLFYRIKKYQEGSDTPIQNFWIPAEKGYRGIRYIDTQVRYGKMYRYEVCAFKLVIGTEYKFSEKDAGVINFDEDLQEFIDASKTNLEDLIGISIIRPAIQQTADEYSLALPAELGFGTINVDELTAVSIADFIEEKNIISSNLVEVNNYSRIALFANSMDLFGVGTYRGVKISQEFLSEKELQSLETIRQAWACLTNTNKSDPNKLAEIEILLNKVVALGNIREKIVERYEKVADRKEKWTKFWEGFALTLGAILITVGTAGIGLGVIAGVAAPAAAVAGIIGGAVGAISGVSTILGATLGGTSKRVNSTGLTPADLTKSDLENLYADISTLTSVTRAPLSIGADDRYWIDLDNPVTFNSNDSDLPEEFTKVGRREILPLFKFDDQGEDESNADFKERKRRHIELIESTFELRANQLGTLVGEYLGCYQDFVEAAADFNVVLDYKRMNKYDMIVESTPTLKFAEIPYFKDEGMILDNPPIYPNVNVITYKGISDRLSFFMNSGQGQIEVKPTTFSDEEETFIKNYRKSRKLNDFQPILYKSDETENLGTVFEIRRLSVPPQNYQSFREANVVTTSNQISTGKNTPAATFDEEINSNTKYYYMFRVFDRRGTVSYPSGVMEIEIVENSGIIYPVIKPYEFKKQKADTTKNLKRLLNIVPRITQVLPPQNTSSYTSLSAGPTSILGREEESLFGKEFKLRLTSKKTGKVVDLNLNFNANVVEVAEAE